jgi:hypothetical protein
MSSRVLNISGLMISLIAAGLMFFFPFYTTPITSDSFKPYLWTNSGKVPRWKVLVAKLGPILLGLGFLLQIIAAAM